MRLPFPLLLLLGLLLSGSLEIHAQSVRTVNGAIQLEISGAFLTLSNGQLSSACSGSTIAGAVSEALLLNVSLAALQPQINNVVLLLNGTTDSISTLTNSLFNEETRALNIEGSIAGSVADEKNRAMGVEAAEQGRATAVESSVAASVSNEVVRAMNIEGSLGVSVSAEKTRVLIAESSLSGSIASESMRAMNAESSLSGVLAGVVGVEPSRAQVVEGSLARSITSLAATIGAETSRALVAESNITSVVFAESSRIMLALQGVNASVGAEKTRATQAEGAEMQRAKDAESALAINITTDRQRALVAEASIVTALSARAFLAEASSAQLQTALAQTQSSLVQTQQAFAANMTLMQATLLATQTSLVQVQATLATFGAAVRPLPTGYVGDGLFIHYDFSYAACYPGSGTAVFDLQGAQMGALMGSPVYGGSGLARYFTFVRSAASTYVYMGPAIPFAQSVTELTMEVWAYHNTIGTDIGAMISSQNDGAGSWGASINTDGRGGAVHGGGPNSYHFQIRVAGGYTTDGTFGNTATNSVQTGVWVHVVATRDASGLKSVYQNGALMKTLGTYAGTIGWTSTRWQLGMEPDSTASLYRWYDGRIAIARIYNRALTAVDVLSNFNGQRARFGV